MTVPEPATLRQRSWLHVKRAASRRLSYFGVAFAAAAPGALYLYAELGHDGACSSFTATQVKRKLDKVGRRRLGLAVAAIQWVAGQLAARAAGTAVVAVIALLGLGLFVPGDAQGRPIDDPTRDAFRSLPAAGELRLRAELPASPGVFSPGSIASKNRGAKEVLDRHQALISQPGIFHYRMREILASYRTGKDGSRRVDADAVEMWIDCGRHLLLRSNRQRHGKTETMLIDGARFVGYASEKPAGRQIDVEMGVRWRDVMATVDPWNVICPAASKQRPVYRLARSSKGPGNTRDALFTTGDLPILGLGKAGRKNKVFLRYEIVLEEATGALTRAATIGRDRRGTARLVDEVKSFEVLPSGLSQSVFQMPPLPSEATAELEAEVAGLSRERVMEVLSKKWGEQHFKPFWLGQRIGNLPLREVEVEPLTARQTPHIYLSYGFGSDEKIDVYQWPAGSPEANAWWNENEPNRKLQVGDFPAQLQAGPDLIVNANGTLLVIEGFSQTDSQLLSKVGQDLAAL